MNEDLLIEGSSTLISETHWSVSFFFLALFSTTETRDCMPAPAEPWCLDRQTRPQGAGAASGLCGQLTRASAPSQGRSPHVMSALLHPPPPGFCLFSKLVLQPPHGFAELFLCTLLSFTHQVRGPSREQSESRPRNEGAETATYLVGGAKTAGHSLALRYLCVVGVIIHLEIQYYGSAHHQLLLPALLIFFFLMLVQQPIHRLLGVGCSVFYFSFLLLCCGGGILKGNNPSPHAHFRQKVAGVVCRLVFVFFLPRGNFFFLAISQRSLFSSLKHFCGRKCLPQGFNKCF